jgi:hypothetical protein
MKTKFNLGRDKLKSDYIHSQQDYKKVVDGFQNLKPPIWKNPWFYGPVGLASLAVILVTTLQTRVNAYGNNTTLKGNLETTLSQPMDTPCIKEPISDQNIAYQIYDVFPEKGMIIELESGTSISIPAYSLQSKKGTTVQVKIREFQDKASAFLAGIPMDYGPNTAFESAGMIEIRAEKDGKSIALAQKKPMDINLSLYKPTEGFQFWKLDENKNEWKETSSIIKAPAPKKIEKNIKAIEINILDKQSKIEICERKIANISIVKSDISSSQSMIPAKNSRKLVIDFKQNDFPELKGYKDLEFEYILPASNSEANLKEYAKRIKYAQSQIWNDMSFDKQGGHYLATFINEKETWSLPIRPVLKGKSLEDIQSKMATAAEDRNKILMKLQEEKKTYEKEQAELKREHEKLKSQLIAQIQRGTTMSMEQRASQMRERALANKTVIQQGTVTFRTNSFGVFNCDKPIPYPPHFPVFLTFETSDGVEVHMDNAFVFDLKQSTRYSFGGYYSHKQDQIGWFNHESTLVIIDDRGEVYYRKNVNEQLKNTNKVIVEQMDKKALTLENIKNLISETAIFV